VILPKVSTDSIKNCRLPMEHQMSGLGQADDSSSEFTVGGGGEESALGLAAMLRVAT
jgi:hypothetical protein